METFTLKRGDRTFTVTAPDEQSANAELDDHIATSAQPKIEEQKMGTLEDILRSGGSGLLKGGAYVAGMPGDIGDLMRSGTDILARKAGIEPPSEEARAAAAPAVDITPSSTDVIGGIEKVTGDLYEPQTTAGKYAHTIGEFAPAAVGGLPGLGRRFLGRAAVPAVASEAAGQAAESIAPGAEPYARVAGALGGAAIGPRIAAAMRPAVPDMSRRASGIMREAVNAPAAQRLGELGPEGMLLDVSPSALGTAQGVVTKPGRGRDVLVDALEARHRGREGRLLTDADTALGEAVPPRSVATELERQNRMLGPDYTRVKGGAAPVDLSDLSLQINNALPTLRGKPQKALAAVKRMIDGNVLSAQETHNIRRALDDVIQSENIGSFERTLLTDARTVVDNQLASAAPGIKALDETFAARAGQREALESGGDILGSGKTALYPEELAAQRQAMSGGERVAQRIGARSEIDRIMRTTANDLTALRRVVKGEGDWNRAKLAEVFGEAEANRIISSVDREAAFNDAYNKVVQNSQTAQRQQASQMIDKADAPSLAETPAIYERVAQIPEMALRGGTRALRRGVEASRSDALREELAQILTSRGGDRDTMVRNILQNAAQNPPDRAELTRALIALRASQPAAGQ